MKLLEALKLIVLCGMLIMGYKCYRNMLPMIVLMERMTYCESRIDALTIRVNTSLMLMQHAFDRYDEKGLLEKRHK
jgi:hypothetical protein